EQALPAEKGLLTVQTAGSPPSIKDQAPAAQENDTTVQAANIPPSLIDDITPEEDDDSSPLIPPTEKGFQNVQAAAGSPPPLITRAFEEFDQNIKERLSQIKSDELSNIEREANNRIGKISTKINEELIFNQEEINKFILWFKTSVKKLNTDQILAGLAFYLKSTKILNHNEKNKDIYVGYDKLGRKIMHEIIEKILKEITMDLKKLVEILNDKIKKEGKNYQLKTVKQENNGGLLEQINDIFRP
ncbi:MAG: hypothetical protein MHPSP_002579, partial [Paramarteilia canceri]